MDHQTNVLRKILPRGALSLGWLVSNAEDPLQGYHIVTDISMPVITATISNLSDSRKTDSSFGFGSFLSGVLRTGCGLKKGVSINLTATSYFLYTLPNADEWFEKACASEKLREWFEHKIERLGPIRLRIHLIVGLHVAKGVQFAVHQTDRAGGSTDMNIPVSALIGDPGILGSLINPGISASYNTKNENQQSFEANDLIYAVQYRQVKFNWLSSKKMNTLYLSRKTCWKIMATDAGEEEDDEDDEDTIEVKLSTENDEVKGTQVAFEDETGEKFLVEKL